MNFFKPLVAALSIPVLALALTATSSANSSTDTQEFAMDSKCFPTDVDGVYICCHTLPDGTIECTEGLYT